ncbi:hypothetical protein KI387_009586 [Taxus chinensis]|uniref:Uncharacterized protein n=1 Tax=Taxus chinensis TaxID=29808 RepID=A0AA38KTH6_TAXCH|nr:hypothetical protein KI387_009586 [Taxus chinensis]
MEGRQKKGQGVGLLHAAARNGDLDFLRSFYASNPTSTLSLINARDNHSRTPESSIFTVHEFNDFSSLIWWRLHLAAWSGQTMVVQFLCELKADVRAAAVDAMAAIHFASQKGHLEIVRILLRSGASVNACTRKGMSALHYAVQGGHVELVKLLIHKGASLSAETKARKKPIDLAKDDQVRLVLTSGEVLKGHKGSQNNRSQGASTSNDTEGKPEDPSMEIEGMPGVLQKDQEAEKSGQREIEEEETTVLVGSQPKKPKVDLSHLVDDDTLEGEC